MTDIDAAAAPVDPKDRGSLVVSERVVERISTRAAEEVAGVVSTGTALDGALGRRYPKAQAEVAGRRASVRLDLAVAWPSPLATTARAVRDRVRSRLLDLAALEADSVDVTIAKVVHAEPQIVRRVT